MLLSGTDEDEDEDEEEDEAEDEVEDKLLSLDINKVNIKLGNNINS